MSQATRDVRIYETATADEWPVRTQTVSYVGQACVIRGSADFDFADLHTVRRRFPGRHVTLDGDVITVWPPSRQGD